MPLEKTRSVIFRTLGKLVCLPPYLDLHHNHRLQTHPSSGSLVSGREKHRVLPKINDQQQVFANPAYDLQVRIDERAFRRDLFR